MSDSNQISEQTTTQDSANLAPTTPFVPPTPVTPLPSASIFSSFTTPQQVSNRFAKIDAKIAKMQQTLSEKEETESKDLPTIDESNTEQTYEQSGTYDNNTSENHQDYEHHDHSNSYQHQNSIDEMRRKYDLEMIKSENEKLALQQAYFNMSQQLAQVQYEQSVHRYHSSSSSQGRYSVAKNISRPEDFIGDSRSDVNTWIATMRNFLALTNTPVEIQSQVAGTFLKQGAAQWYNTLPISQRSQLVDFEALARMILNRFNPLDVVAQARHKLTKLTQTGSVDAFNQRFMQLMQLIPTMNEEERVASYRSKLKMDLQMILVTQNYGSLSDIMNVALRTDALLFENNAYSNSHRSNQRSFGGNKNKYRNEQGTASSTPVTVNSVKIDTQEQHYEMENQPQGQQVPLNFVSPKPMDEAERQRCRDNRLCFRCRRPGHISTNCPVFTSSNQRPGLKPSAEISSKKY